MGTELFSRISATHWRLVFRRIQTCVLRSFFWNCSGIKSYLSLFQYLKAHLIGFTKNQKLPSPPYCKMIILTLSWAHLFPHAIRVEERSTRQGLLEFSGLHSSYFDWLSSFTGVQGLTYIIRKCWFARDANSFCLISLLQWVTSLIYSVFKMDWGTLVTVLERIFARCRVCVESCRRKGFQSVGAACLNWWWNAMSSLFHARLTTWPHHHLLPVVGGWDLGEPSQVLRSRYRYPTSFDFCFRVCEFGGGYCASKTSYSASFKAWSRRWHSRYHPIMEAFRYFLVSEPLCCLF